MYFSEHFYRMKTLLLDAKQINNKLNRLAYEIYENNLQEKEILIAGIAGNGFIVAKRLTQLLKKISPLNVKLEELKINKENPRSSSPQINFSEKEFNKKVVILVDDVMNSGKTLIYGVRLFLDMPIKRLHTVVLVDRSHTQFPVKADFVGLSLSTTLQDHIVADLSKKGEESVYLV